VQASAPAHSHYYSPSPSAESRPRLIEYALSGSGAGGNAVSGADSSQNARLLKFMTDSGVFAAKGVDFGSDLLIRSIPPLSGRLLDMGCGYGAVGISLKCLNPGIERHMADINERAVELCRRNYALNCPGAATGASAAFSDGSDGGCGSGNGGCGSVGNYGSGNGGCGANSAVNGAVTLSDGFERICGIFDSIAMNPPIRAGKHLVFRLYGGCRSFLAPGGALYVVIQKKQGMESSLSELRRLFGNCCAIARKSGYFVLRAEKRAPER
jgi:16S rRNA (guanine1207-N2)-methyltransferase